MKLDPMKTLIVSSICENFTLDFQGRTSKTFVQTLTAKHFIESKNDSGWKGSQEAKQWNSCLKQS